MFLQRHSARGKFVLAALAALGLLAFQAFAKPVAKDEAAKAVAGWLRRPGHGLTAPVGNAVRETQLCTDASGQASFYVVYLKPSGFVIVPADDLVEPVIAFCSGPKFVNSDTDPLGALVRNDLPERLAAARARPQAPSRVAAQRKWAQLKSAAAVAPAPLTLGAPSVTDVRVAPMTQTLWSEETVEDLYPGLACYNYYTPPGPDGSEDNYPCGCVATAMAQLMYFWQYPTAGVGTGSFTIYVGFRERPQTAQLRGGDGAGGAYQWSSMPASPTPSITLAQQEAIGDLCYDAGVSVMMAYEADGSGAYLTDAATALKSTFMYSNCIQAANDYVSTSNIGAGLIGMINPDLDAGFPVILGITGPDGGHAVVADGYGYDTTTLYHHLNMGWSGTDNAWYNLPNIDADPEDVFDVIQNCLYNVYATGSGEIISGRAVDASGNPISGVTVAAAGVNGTTYSNIATTNAVGIYSFANVPSAGSYTLTASASGRYFLALNETTGTSTPDVTTSGNVWGADFTDLGGPPTGSLQVTLQPAGAVTAGAQWNVDGNGWLNSGAIVTGLSLGSHTVNFNTVAGWNTPSPSSTSVTIAYDTTATVTGTYVQQTGSVQVTLGPAGAVSAGARWNVDGGAWQASAATLANVPVGSHTVNFSPVYGWNAPSAAPITVADNALTAISENYTVQTSSLTITLLPAAAATAGAQWRVDGGAWQNSGAIVTGLDVATHAVDYLPATGWAEPPSESVAILNDQTDTLTRTYVADLTAPAVSDEYPASHDDFVDPLAAIKLHVTDAGAGVNLSTVQITASRDGGATTETLCNGGNLTPVAPTSSSASSGAAYLGYYDATANGNTVFKGRTYIGGSAPNYVFSFEPDTDAAFGYDETVTIGVTASDWAGNTMTPLSTNSPPSLYDFTITPRNFGCNLQVDGGTAGDVSAAAATDSAGNIWVAWERDPGAIVNEGTIWLAKRKDPSDVWSFGPEIPVTTLAQNGDCHKPAIAIAASGTIYAAYEVHSLPTPAIGVVSATTAEPTTWTQLGSVTGASFTLQTAPAITCVNSTGTLCVAGVGADAGGVQQVGIATLAAGATAWTVTAVTSGGSDKSSPAIAQDANGVVYVVWTNSADNNLYGADSSSAWATIHQVTSGGAAASPAIATEAGGNVLHFAWVVAGGTNPDIQYADTYAAGGGWPATPLAAGTSVMAGSGILNANFPRIAVTGTTSASANAQVFIAWQGRLSNVSGDTDIYFTEMMWNGQFYPTPVQVSNVPAGLGLTAESAHNPALGVMNGMPYAAWTDLREAGASHIWFAEAMGARRPPPSPIVIGPAGTAGGAPAEFLLGANPHFTEVDIAVPNDAFSTSVSMTVNELSNPVVECPAGSGIFAADGSGLYLDIIGGSGCGGNDNDGDVLADWITVTIHLAAGATLPSPLAVYRLAPPTFGSMGAYTWTTDWIQNVSYSAGTNELTFQTKHLSTFGVGSSGSAASGSGGSGSGGGGGGGGCAMSAGGEPDILLLLLPLTALGIWVAMRLVRRGRSAKVWK